MFLGNESSKIAYLLYLRYTGINSGATQRILSLFHLP
jgi:hypothetical protein